MKKILYAICAAALLLTVSCENLDLFPESEAALSENEVFSTYEGYHGFFLKCYLAMAMPTFPAGMPAVRPSCAPFTGPRKPLPTRCTTAPVPATACATPRP